MQTQTPIESEYRVKTALNCKYMRWISMSVYVNVNEQNASLKKNKKFLILKCVTIRNDNS